MEGGSGSEFKPKRSAVPPRGDSWAAGGDVWGGRKGHHKQTAANGRRKFDVLAKFHNSISVHDKK